MASTQKKLKGFIGAFIRFSGLFRIINWFIKNRVTILLYHNPQLEAFEGHVKYLKKNFNIISLDTLTEAIHHKDWSHIPTNSLVITIDDGFKGNYALLNLCKKYKIRPTIYLCSHIVNTNRRFWYELDGVDPHLYFARENNERLKELSEKFGYEPDKEYPDRQALNLQEIRELAPYVDFQSHSKFHPVLPKCSDEELSDEITVSKEHLEEMLSKKISHFSYPNGDYTEREIVELKKAGYRSARTCDIGWNHKNSDPFRLKAMGIEDDVPVNEFVSQLYGISGFIRFAKQGSFTGKHPDFI